MKVLISGSHGLIGTHLAKRLRHAGHETGALVRREVRYPDREVAWDPASGTIDSEGVAQYDAVVHLAGKSIAGLWTRSHMDEVLRSRVDGTHLIASTLALLGDDGPRVLVSASGVGYYGDRGDESLDESSSTGNGFLAMVCQKWEAAAQPARDAGIRVVHPRLGIVLSHGEGFLAPLTPLFALGLGATLGSGRQWMSYVHIDDVTRAMQAMLEQDDLDGVVNVATPEPVTNRTFTKTFASVLGRPAFLRIPEFLLARLPGGMGQEMILVSQKAQPKGLLDHGFEFEYPTLSSALVACFKHG
ncbi:TIGR01777 family oxidoreductase [bacterium]|nr:TIGR01777 family oxidoreductase [bacterium]